MNKDQLRAINRIVRLMEVNEISTVKTQLTPDGRYLLVDWWSNERHFGKAFPQGPHFELRFDGQIGEGASDVES